MGALKAWTGTKWGPLKAWTGTKWAPMYAWDGAKFKPSAPAGPTVVSHSKGVDATAVTSFTPALPTGLQNGDLLLLAMHCPDTSVGAVITPTVPAGWTVRTAIANQGTCQRAFYSATYTAGLVMPSWALSAARRNDYTCVAVRGATSAVYGLTDLGASSTDTVAPSVAATAPGLVVRQYGRKDNLSTTVSTPAGHTLIGSVLSTPGPAAHAMACWAPVAAAGATGTATATWSAASANGSSWSVAVA